MNSRSSGRSRFGSLFSFPTKNRTCLARDVPDIFASHFGFVHDVTDMTQTAGHKMAPLKIVFSRLSNGAGTARRNTDAGSNPRCGKGIFSQSQLPVQTLLRCPYSQKKIDK